VRVKEELGGPLNRRLASSYGNGSGMGYLVVSRDSKTASRLPFFWICFRAVRAPIPAAAALDTFLNGVYLVQ